MLTDGYLYKCQKEDCGLNINSLTILWIDYKNIHNHSSRWMAQYLHMLCKEHTNKLIKVWEKKYQVFYRDFNKEENQALAIQYTAKTLITSYEVNLWGKSPDRVYKQIMAQVLKNKLPGFLPKTDLEKLIKACLIEYEVKSEERSKYFPENMKLKKLWISR